MGNCMRQPVVNNTMSLYYNKDLFDKFGVSYPKDGMTWDEVLELNRQLDKNGGRGSVHRISLIAGSLFRH